jgi:hypothetical protein
MARIPKLPSERRGAGNCRRTEQTNGKDYRFNLYTCQHEFENVFWDFQERKRAPSAQLAFQKEAWFFSASYCSKSPAAIRCARLCTRASHALSVSRTMPPQLLALTEGPSILLDKPILLLGRHQECDIQLVSRKVSRRHCCIAQVGDYLVVRDLGSTNGIRINGVRVLEGHLKSGDELTIGSYRYQIRWDAMAPAPPRTGRATSVQRMEDASLPISRSVGDDMLESCEEPVPLAEPPRGPTKLEDNSPRPIPRGADLPSVAQDLDKSVPTERAPRSLILPDEIELAPSSDVLPKGRERPSPPR